MASFSWKSLANLKCVDHNAGAWLDKTVYSMALEELLQSFSNL